MSSAPGRPNPARVLVALIAFGLLILTLGIALMPFAAAVPLSLIVLGGGIMTLGLLALRGPRR
jgi:hypothetical protein